MASAGMSLPAGSQPIIVLATQPVASSGTYLINASIRAVVAPTDMVKCILALASGATSATGDTFASNPGSAYVNNFIPLAGVVTVTAGDSIELTCTSALVNNSTGQSAIGIGTVLNAMQVSNSQ